MLRVFGVAVALFILVYGLYKYVNGRYSKLDLIISFLLSVGLGSLAINPAIGDIPARLLGMQTRWFAVLVVANAVTFGLFLYVLNKANQSRRDVGKLVRAIAREKYQQQYHAEKEGGKTIAVVMPAYNEAEAIGNVLNALPKVLYGHTVQPIVVIDGGTDNTEEVVKTAHFRTATHIVNRGQGDALRTGFEIAIDDRADIIMTMDADGQHRVEDMGALLLPVIRDEADYVMGSRFLGEYEDKGGARHLGILGFTKLINLLGRVRITDCTNGFRAIRGSDLAKLELKEDRFNAPELIMEAAKKRLRIKEVPVTIATREIGESKKPRSFRYPLGFFRTIVQVWLR